MDAVFATYTISFESANIVYKLTGGATDSTAIAYYPI